MYSACWCTGELTHTHTHTHTNTHKHRTLHLWDITTHKTHMNSPSSETLRHTCTQPCVPLRHYFMQNILSWLLPRKPQQIKSPYEAGVQIYLSRLGFRRVRNSGLGIQDAPFNEHSLVWQEEHLKAVSDTQSHSGPWKGQSKHPKLQLFTVPSLRNYVSLPTFSPTIYACFCFKLVYEEKLYFASPLSFSCPEVRFCACAVISQHTIMNHSVSPARLRKHTHCALPLRKHRQWSTQRGWLSAMIQGTFIITLHYFTDLIQGYLQHSAKCKVQSARDLRG